MFAPSQAILQKISSTLPATRKDLIGHNALQGILLQQQQSLSSRISTAVLVSALKSGELDLIRQQIFDIAKFPQLSFSQNIANEVFNAIRQSNIWKDIDVIRSITRLKSDKA